MIVPDACNHRVLIWNTVPTQSYTQADLVLGQISFGDNDYNKNLAAPSADSLAYPLAAATDGTNLVISDNSNNRVLIWNTFPTTNGQPADVVIGQADFVTGSVQAVSASSLSQPMGVMISGTKLFVADTGNNRVLVWNSIPTSNGQAADLVIGQANFTDNTCVTEVCVPYNVVTDGTKLLIEGNQMSPHIWNAIPTTNNVAADLNMGNQPTLSRSWNGINDALFVNGKLIIVGGNNTGVFVWNSVPTAVPAYADYEIGSNASSAPTALNMPSSSWAASDGTHLAISDGHRVLIWNSIPADNSTPANVVLGQQSMNTSQVNFSPINAQNLAGPTDAIFVGSKLVVSDAFNNRILIWNSVPTSSHQAANVVVGQAAMSDSGWGTSATNLGEVWDLETDGTRLFATDPGNNRVLMWNSLPTANGAAADIVFGQPDMVSSGAGTSATTLNSPTGIASNGSIVAVTDAGNNRVLIWNSIPTADGQPADVVLGQVDMTSNGGGTSASNFSWPDGIKIYGSKLIVSDLGNCRILIWNTIPTSDGQPADVVLGQPDMTSGTCSSASASTMGESTLTVDASGRLYASDWTFNRILVWNTIPTINGTAADSVLGQLDFTSSASGSSATRLKRPWGLSVKDGAAWIADFANFRVLKMILP